MLDRVVKTGTRGDGPSPSTAPVRTNYRESDSLKPGQAAFFGESFEPGIETSVEPLKHSHFGGNCEHINNTCKYAAESQTSHMVFFCK